ncbi:sporulation protein YpjB [Paenibacillus sp. ACRRX]|uniref:sporulation protein YpjB n=1 Tax=Paenibacillus sp. ACRRX TaxID=2918206 RepID=UPI001EF68A51|nr:sporulation protein YpjB [Paenibacillus sp. ACRRX]MCG7406477.1 sporulation protein YpjB [Paenibacillus sp. ACRRX]
MHRYRIVSVLLALIMLIFTSPLLHALNETVEESKEQNMHQGWREVDTSTERLYRKVASGDVSGALHTVKKLELVLASPGLFDSMTAEQIKAITETYVDMKRELHAASINEKELSHAAAKFKLAVDAITHPNRSMWLQYEQVLRDDLEQMVQAATKQQWEQASRLWLEHTDRIMPAVAIQRSVQTVEMLKSINVLVMKINDSRVSRDQARRALQDYEPMLMKALFGHAKDSPAFANVAEDQIPLRVVMWLACIVTVTLAYVAYQKYRYQEHHIHAGPWNKSS